MIYRNVELFNVSRIDSNPDIPGVLLNRFSEEAIKGLDRGEDRRGPATQAYCNDIEIRFESNSRSVNLFLGAWDNDGYIAVFNGEHFNSIHHLPQGEITQIQVERHPRLALMPEDGNERFNKNIWRVIFLKRFQAVFSDISVSDGIFTPPLYNKKTPVMLAYGSSISFGAGTGPASYLHHLRILSREIGYQLMNKSMPGSCFCEMSYGDFLSDIPADLYYYELGGNMRLRHTPKEFEKRAKHLVGETRRKNPKAPILLLTVYPLLGSIPDEDFKKASRVIKEYNKTLAKLSQDDSLIYLIDSGKVISEPGILSYDGLHPSGYGNIVMADRLHEIINSLI